MTTSPVPGVAVSDVSRELAPRRTRVKLRHDRALTANMYLQGRAIADIATEIGVSDSTIRRDLRLIMEYWRRSAVFDFNQRKMRELAALEMTESEAWSAWRRSCESKIKTVHRVRSADVTEDGESEITTDITTTEQRDGDPRFLAIIEKCITTRLKVIGALTPSGDTNEGISTGAPQPSVRSIKVVRSITVETTEVIPGDPHIDDPVGAAVIDQPQSDEPNF